jgi:hypothetical protein
MKNTLSLYDFQNAFDSVRPDNFSYEGLTVLFDYLENLEQDTGEEIELDVIALCCDFEEMRPEEVISAYNLDENEDVLEFLSMNTSVVGDTSDSIVFHSF